MISYLFFSSIFLERLLNISVGPPGPLILLFSLYFSSFCVFDYSLGDFLVSAIDLNFQELFFEL